MKLKTLIFFLLTVSFAYSQEICDNAIDDDGDGKIDLFDEECHCGAGLNAQAANLIPNPDFNLSTCCPPQTWSTNNNLNCVNDWSASNSQWGAWGVQYLNSCDTCGLYSQWWNNITPIECTSPVSDGFFRIDFLDQCRKLGQL